MLKNSNLSSEVNFLSSDDLNSSWYKRNIFKAFRFKKWAKKALERMLRLQSKELSNLIRHLGKVFKIRNFLYNKHNLLTFDENFERLYVPNQKNQQLLEQAANSIGAQACLSALGINYDLIEAPNTEWMSKNGHVPLLIGQNSARNVASGKIFSIILSSLSV